MVKISGKILIAERGDCTFVSKARLAQATGALALMVCDNVPGSSEETQPMFAMSGDGTNDVTIPVVFMYSQEFNKLSNIMKEKPKLCKWELYKWSSLNVGSSQGIQQERQLRLPNDNYH